MSPKSDIKICVCICVHVWGDRRERERESNEAKQTIPEFEKMVFMKVPCTNLEIFLQI